MAKQYEYEYDKETEYTLPDFFSKYKDLLPLLVIVTGGYCGESRYDDFSNNQVVRLHKTCKQLRALGRLAGDATEKRDEFLSIPADKTYGFTVVKSSTSVGEVQTLEEILEENKLPVQVRYATSNIRLPLTLQRMRRINILIMKTYFEDFIQGNCLQDDVLSPAATVMAVSPEISVSIITGYRNKSPEKFQAKLKSMDLFVERNVKFPEGAGCAEMTVFERNSLTTGTGNLVPPDLLPDYNESDLYDLYELPPEPDPCWLPPKPPKSDSKYRPPLPNRPTENLQLREITNKTDNSEGMKGDSLQSSHKNNTAMTDSSKGESLGSSRKNNTAMSDDDSAYGSFSGSFVTDKSVTEIQDLLKILNLSHHCNFFYKHLINGSFLESLDEKILRNDFGFKHVEAVRLMMYVRTGHIPK